MIPALRFDGVTFSYGAVAVLHGLSFAITPGERVALLGKNGAGKSTVVRHRGARATGRGNRVGRRLEYP